MLVESSCTDEVKLVESSRVVLVELSCVGGVICVGRVELCSWRRAVLVEKGCIGGVELC